jgi:hypothetical protein
VKQTVGPFTGLDVRRTAGAADPQSLRAASNVSLTADGSIKARGAWRKIVDLPGDTLGLYSLGGYLRCAGWGAVTSLVPAEITIQVDVVSGSGFTGIHSVLPYDGDAAFGVYPYIVLQTSTGYEHHWVRPGVASTKIDLPFEPGPAAVKIASKVVTVPKDGGSVRFSSTLNGPTDYVEQADAGFLPVVKHASGDRTVNGLGFYDNQLAVIFDDSVQLWDMSPDPSLISLSRVLNGVGTPYVKTAVNVRGDLMYLSRSGFINLYTVAVTGLIESDHQIGAPIEPLTSALDVARTTPIATWWGERSQYLCAIGANVYAYTQFSSKIGDKKGGWTKWTAPAAVQSMTVHLGKLYIRCDHAVYTLDEEAEDADTAEAATQFLVGKYPGRLKFWRVVDSFQEGDIQTRIYSLPKYPTEYEQGPDLRGTTEELGDIPLITTTEALSLELRGGSTGWRVDQLVLTYDPLKG